MISTREFSILSRIARLIVHDHRNGRLEAAEEKLVSPEAKLIAQQLKTGEGKSALAKQILEGAEAQFRSKPSLTS